MAISLTAKGLTTGDVEAHLADVCATSIASETRSKSTEGCSGGFLAAMLYDTVGPALLATLSAGEFIVTHELRTHFVRPARVGRFVGRGRVVERDGTRVLLEATLSDASGEIVATAEATAEVVRREVSRSDAAR